MIKVFTVLLPGLVIVWTSSLDTPASVAGTDGSPIGISDHCYASVIIKTEQAVPDISFSHTIYLKSHAERDGILNDLCELDWADIYRQVDCVAFLNDGLEKIIVRRIPSPPTTFHINP